MIKYMVDNGKAPVFYAKVGGNEEGGKNDGGSSNNAVANSNEVFYTEGIPLLRDVRLQIAKYSIQ
jgi:hypothetical protein